MLSHIPLDVLIVDPDSSASRELAVMLAPYRKGEEGRLVGNIATAATIAEAKDVIGQDDVNCIIIDPVSLGLDHASQFIFEIRRAIPRIIFVLYNDSDAANSDSKFYEGERKRFLHYFKLNKKSRGKKLEKKLLHVIHLCLTDIRLEISLARRKVIEIRQFGGPPIEISESLGRFDLAHPPQQKTAFLIMSFEDSPAHRKIEASIKKTLAKFNIKALRADEHDYHDNLYDNILTYMHGCDFGIAVVERISKEPFNPNIALEIGYMKGLKKSVCILKDKTFRTIPADLLGKLYREIDCQNIQRSIDSALSGWVGNLLSHPEKLVRHR